MITALTIYILDKVKFSDDKKELPTIAVIIMSTCIMFGVVTDVSIIHLLQSF